MGILIRGKGSGMKLSTDSETRIAQIYDEAPTFLSEFYGITEEEVRDRIAIGSSLVREEWGEYGEELDSYEEFYAKVVNYPFELAKFNDLRRLTYLHYIYTFTSALLDSLGTKRLDILEFGGGGGELSLLLSHRHNVTHIDIAGNTIDYAKFRVDKYGENVRFLNEIPNETFDIISMQDVCEHLEDLDSVMSRASSVLRDGGYLVSSGLWYNPNHPLHLDKYMEIKAVFPIIWAMEHHLWLSWVFATESDLGSFGIGLFKKLPNLISHPCMVLSKSLQHIKKTEYVIPHVDLVYKIIFSMSIDEGA